MKRLNLIYFSPTGTTKKILQTISKELFHEKTDEYNLSDKDFDRNIDLANDDLAIIGVPVYGGRVPITAVERLEKLHASNTPAVLVVLYGNRHYDDALLELKEIATKSGFNIIAGAAFIGEHSFSTKAKPIAEGRPDCDDLQKAIGFAHKILEKIKIETDEEIDLPGNNPYKARGKSLEPMSPETVKDECNNCGLCIDVCPTKAISFSKGIVTDKNLCIWCCACVKKCPKDARFFDNETIDTFRDRLHSLFSERKEPEFFM